MTNIYQGSSVEAVNAADIVIQGTTILKNRNEVSILILPIDERGSDMIWPCTKHCTCVPIYNPRTHDHTHNKCCRCDHHEEKK